MCPARRHGPAPAAPARAVPAAPARPSALLALPPAVLGGVLEHLTPPELVRTVTMTTKHPALSSFAEGTGPGEAALWTRALRHCLARFMPAREWFEMGSTGFGEKD